MPNYNIRRFADADALKHMKPELLLALLSPHQSYFAKHGIALCDTSASQLPYEELAHVLLNPDDDIPPRLVDTLYYINEMATVEDMDKLLAAAAEAGIALDASAEVSPADVAAEIWLKDRSLLERKHAEQFLTRPRSYESFQSHEFPGLEPELTRSSRAALEADLDLWFDTNKRGRGCRVFAYPKLGETWFSVRHGQPFKREGSLKKGKSSSVYYRPEKHDIVIYKQALSELCIRAGSKGEKDLYRKLFGLHLFGSEDYFPAGSKYSLEALREQGEAALVCSDVPGMEWMKLTELRFYWGGAQHEIEIRRADDLFATFHGRRRDLSDYPPISLASFKVKFLDAKTPRSVTIRPPNIAEYLRDDDGARIEQWLIKRGFISAELMEEDAEPERTLAGT